MQYTKEVPHSGAVSNKINSLAFHFGGDVEAPLQEENWCRMIRLMVMASEGSMRDD